MGYGGTAAPAEPEFYTYKRAADDIAALAKEIGVHSIILGGHDWGGAVVYRVAMYYPELISAVFSVCTPFMPPQPEYKPMSRLPNFKYQLQFSGPEVEDKIKGEEKIRQFLTGLYGGRTKEGELGFGVETGIYFDKIEHLGPSPLLTKEEMDFYVERYAINGMHGPTNVSFSPSHFSSIHPMPLTSFPLVPSSHPSPTNQKTQWYRTDELNFSEDQTLKVDPATFKFKMPFLFIGGARDAALPPAMAAGMEKYFRSLTKGEVNASHWALWEKPEEVNLYIKEFLFGVGRKSSL